MPAKKKTVTPEYTRRAIDKYKAKYKQIAILMQPELKDLMMENLGDKSMTQYITDLIIEDLKKKGVDLP